MSRATESHCANNHVWLPETTGFTNKGWKFCRLCKRLADSKRRASSEAVRKLSAERSRAWRKINTQRSRELALSHYDKVRAYIDREKSKPCMDCGGTFPPYVMDFDHRDPETKVFNVGKARSLKAVQKEIAKCDLVCANCHRIRTWEGKTRAAK